MSQGGNIKSCFTDNCCTWKRGVKKELNETPSISCGSTCGEKISRRHPYSFNCAPAFSLMLRQPHDHGGNRKESAPDPETMNRQLDKFVFTWNDIVYLAKLAPLAKLALWRRTKSILKNVHHFNVWYSWSVDDVGYSLYNYHE